MSNRRFIELNSSHRDRNKFPNPSSFDALFNQNTTISSNASNSLDPVYDSVPEYIFKSNQNNESKYPYIENVPTGNNTVKIGTWENNKKNFYCGYHILLFNYGPTGVLERVLDREVVSYLGQTQLAYLDHPLPTSYTYNSTNTKYLLMDTNFNSNNYFNYSFNNNLNFPIVNISSSEKNNIMIDVSGYPTGDLKGLYGYFDNCYFLVNDPNYPTNPTKPSYTYPSSSYNNVRKIIDTSYDFNYPNYLILYLDTELTFIPPGGTIGVITNNDPNLSIKPILNIQFNDIYGSEDARNGWDNFYNGYYIENTQTHEFRKVEFFDDILNIVKIDSPFSQTVNLGGINSFVGTTGYINYNDMYILRKEKPIDYNYQFPFPQVSPATVNIPGIGAVPIANVASLGYNMVPSYNILNSIGSSPNLILLNSNSNSSENFYKGLYIRMISSSPNYNCMLKINNYYPNILVYDGSGKLVSTTPLYLISVDLPNDVNFIPLYSVISFPQNYEILNFSRDNFNPISYSGNIVSQQESVCHDVELLSLMVPNKPLKNAYSIGAYPYFYVVFHTLNITNKNVIYSNNSNSNRAVFIVKSITEDSNKNYSYLSLGGMRQTIKFKPNDNLTFSIYLPNGEKLEFLEPDNFSPYPCKDFLQISGVFSIARL